MTSRSKCPKCGSKHVCEPGRDRHTVRYRKIHRCVKCKHYWTTTMPPASVTRRRTR